MNEPPLQNALAAHFGRRNKMPVFRLQKKNNYTVMSNHHLRDRNLTLKARGLLSQILSLPDDWDYTLRGLVSQNRDGLDAVRSAVRELEASGYIMRRRLRDEDGCFSGCEYIVYECPQPPKESSYPAQAKPTQENPTQDNPTQLNKEVINKDIQNKESYPILSSFLDETVFSKDGDKDMDTDDIYLHYEKLVRRSISYDRLLESHPKDEDAITELYRLIVDTLCTSRKHITISGNRYTVSHVRSRLLRLTGHHILYILDSLSETTAKARNMKSYLVAALFNAPLTIDNYYANRARHDMARGKY
jgi:hypothetical protein